jgi:hypothetical protein
MPLVVLNCSAGTAQKFAAAVAPRLSPELLLTLYQAQVFNKLSQEVRRDILLKLHHADSRLERLVRAATGGTAVCCSAAMKMLLCSCCWPTTSSCSTPCMQQNVQQYSQCRQPLTWQMQAAAKTVAQLSQGHQDVI